MVFKLMLNGSVDYSATTY